MFVTTITVVMTTSVIFMALSDFRVVTSRLVIFCATETGASINDYCANGRVADICGTARCYSSDDGANYVSDIPHIFVHLVEHS